MANREVSVPVPLLLDPELPASWKVLWLGRQLDPDAGPPEVAALTGVSRMTTWRAWGDLTSKRTYPGAPRVKIPAALVANQNIGSQAKILYGLLQTIPHVRGRPSEFTYATLSARSGFSRNTLKRAVAELVGAGWVQFSQTNQLRPIQFRLSNPLLEPSLTEATVAERRLKRANFGGEALMQEYLSLLIDSDQYTDNAQPGFLVNPQTGERLEFDRFYPPSWAFEFHGAQHDGPTERFTQAQVEAQQLRDLIKAGICFYRGIQLVVIRAADLTLDGMIKRVEGALPLRDLAGHEALIELLEDASLRYRAESASKGRPTRAPRSG